MAWLAGGDVSHARERHSAGLWLRSDLEGSEKTVKLGWTSLLNGFEGQQHESINVLGMYVSPDLLRVALNTPRWVDIAALQVAVKLSQCILATVPSSSQHQDHLNLPPDVPDSRL